MGRWRHIYKRRNEYTDIGREGGSDAQGRAVHQRNEGRYMGKKQTAQDAPVLTILKNLLLSYIVTALLLLLLALLLFKMGLAEQIVSIAIIAIYVAATFLGGFLTGKGFKSRRFLWGLVMGAAYFLVLLLISLLFNRADFQFDGKLLTTLVLCTAGGMLGGMFS